jgi:hypothetical protein
MKARAHHFQLKYLLGQMALQDPARFFATFGEGGDPHYFEDLWHGIGENFPVEERVPGHGASMWHRPALTPNATETIVLSLPEPQAQSEAHFVGVFRVFGDRCRVFFLERSLNPMTKEVTTVLAELSSSGRANWGPGSAPVLEDFVRQADAINADPAATPMSFIPMQRDGM